MSEFVLELKNIDKTFGATQVLYGVNFQLRPGEIHALVGENGAGKSTLMNIVYGIVKPDRGEIYVNGELADIKNANIAQKFGIGFVHQEIALCPDVTVAENILMSEINNKATLRVKYADIKKRAAEILKPLVGKNIKPGEITGSLSISNQQVVEIARALSSKCKVLILDEPTAALSESEADALYCIMDKLKAEGIGIVYISHRMSEIFEHCDRATVLRDGYFINTSNVSELTPKSLVSMMVGREIDNIYPPKAEAVKREEPEALLSVEGLTDAGGRFHDIDFKLYKGEILGISGLIGAGRSEVAQGITGFRKLTRGKIVYLGEDITGKQPRTIFDKGLVYLSENRKESGLFVDMSIKHNVSATYVKNVSKGLILNRRAESKQAKKLCTDLNVRCRDIEQLVRNLSGGNQQKVMIAKLLSVTPKIVIMDEPTRGIDVGAKSEIHKLLRVLLSQGIGVIMISSELNEILGMCDRVLIMNEGRICGELADKEIDAKMIMNFASGAHKLESANC